jgi:hypothetical protein
LWQVPIAAAVAAFARRPICTIVLLLHRLATCIMVPHQRLALQVETDTLFPLALCGAVHRTDMPYCHIAASMHVRECC